MFQRYRLGGQSMGTTGFARFTSLNIPDESEPPARVCADEVLFLATIANRLPSKVDSIAEIGFRDDAPFPDGRRTGRPC